MSDLIARAIADLKAELDQQRTRAEAAEQELRDYTAHVAQSRNEDRSKLAAIRAHLVGLDLATLDKDEPTSTHAVTNWWEMRKLIAAAREAQAP